MMSIYFRAGYCFTCRIRAVEQARTAHALTWFPQWLLALWLCGIHHNYIPRRTTVPDTYVALHQPRWSQLSITGILARHSSFQILASGIFERITVSCAEDLSAWMLPSKQKYWMNGQRTLILTGTIHNCHRPRSRTRWPIFGYWKVCTNNATSNAQLFRNRILYHAYSACLAVLGLGHEIASTLS